MSDEEPRIILWDIETTPLVSYTWGTWQTDVIKVKEDWGILCFAWKVIGQKKVHIVARPDFEEEYAANPDDDFKVVEALHEVLSSADITIAHNGDQFDIQKANARFIIHGFDPPTPSQSIDTLKVARRSFAFTSNKLDDLGQTLGLGKKARHNGIATWIGCMDGDPQSWSVMTKYNARDVKLLEAVYLRLRPWIIGHPNMALLSEMPDGCPNCGEHALVKQGFKKLRTMKYQRYQCNNCGAWSRGTKAIKDTPKPMAVN